MFLIIFNVKTNHDKPSMELTNLQKYMSIYFFFECLTKVSGDKLLKFVGIPTWMNLISSFTMVLISAFKCKKIVLYDWSIILIGFLNAYDVYIKIYINLVSSSNLKEVVSQNMYLIFANILTSLNLKTKYNRKQMMAMGGIFILGILQIFYPVPKNRLTNLYWRDLFNCLGSVGMAIAYILFKRRIEKKVDCEWDYSFILSLLITSFATIFYTIDMLFVCKKVVFNYLLVPTLIVMSLSGITQTVLIKIGFILDPFAIFTSIRIVCFFSSFLSDLINDNYVSILQFLLALASTVLCNIILYYDENNNFF